MKVEIWSDIVCPWCYIGKVRFERALEGFEHKNEVEVQHRSFELDPTVPKGETRDVVADLARKKRTGEDEIRQMMAQVEDLAATEGLEYHLTKAPSGNTVDAHRVLHLAAERGLQDEVLTRLYRAHFTELRSVFDRDSLIGLAAETGLDPNEVAAVLDGDRYLGAVADDEERARSLRITGVPFFVIDSRYGISGAQKTELLLQALEQAWAESRSLVTADPGAPVCEDGVCF